MTGPIACFGELRTIATAVEIWEKVKIVEMGNGSKKGKNTP